MTPEELFNGTKKVIKEFHTTDKMLKRCIKLLKISIHPTVITIIISMNISRKIWYKREFGI